MFPLIERKYSLRKFSKHQSIKFLPESNRRGMSRVCFFSFRNVDPTPRQAQCLAACSLVKGGPPFPSFQVGPEGRLHVEPGTGRFPGVAAACPPPLRKWLICLILDESYLFSSHKTEVKACFEHTAVSLRKCSEIEQ